MPKAIQLQDATGTTLASFSFGEVPTGTLSPQKTISLKNTGDLALTGIRVWIEQASTADGALRVTLAGVNITGTTQATATALPDLAVGAAHSGFAEYTGPTVSLDSADLCWITD